LKIYYKESRRNVTSCIELKRRKFNWIAHIMRRNCFLTNVIEGKLKKWEDEKEDVSSYWMMLGKEDTLN
jgi:hypothetical protein